MLITEPNNAFAIVNTDNLMEQQFRLFITAITSELNTREIIIGSGSPEGVVEAIQGQEYMNSAGTASAIKYIKRDNDIAGDKTKGWILI